MNAAELRELFVYFAFFILWLLLLVYLLAVQLSGGCRLVAVVHRSPRGPQLEPRRSAEPVICPAGGPRTPRRSTTPARECVRNQISGENRRSISPDFFFN